MDLMQYNVETDILEPTPELMNGDSEILKNIAGSVRGWAGNWSALYENIILRGLIKQELVATALRLRKPELLEAKFAVLSNAVFHRISDEARQASGVPQNEVVLAKWKQWLGGKVGGF